MQLLSADDNEIEKVKKNKINKKQPCSRVLSVSQLWLHSVTLSLVLNQLQKRHAAHAAENTLKKKKKTQKETHRTFVRLSMVLNLFIKTGAGVCVPVRGTEIASKKHGRIPCAGDEALKNFTFKPHQVDKHGNSTPTDTGCGLVVGFI